jgi:predicted MPP superfamily phosphohydrolase
MVILFIILIITEILTIVVIRQQFYDTSWMRYYFFMMVNIMLSIWLWALWFKTVSFKGIFDEPEHIWMIMNLAGMISGVVIPRIIIILFHFTGKLLRRKAGGHSRLLTNTGIFISLAVFLTVATGTLYTRFNFKSDRIDLKIKNLNPELNGLKIVLISDLHLSSFYHHKDQMVKVMKEIKTENPDILINTGDFVSFGWREFGRFDTILNMAGGKYGSFTVLGNHDNGGYDPFFTEADKENNVLLMKKLMSASGYKILDDKSEIIKIKNARIEMIGVTTRGRFPDIIHGDIARAMSGSDSADLKILLAHDPNQWEKDVTGKTDIDITLSGHTHGMQLGIITKKFKWSPAKYFYPNWNGEYKEGDNYLVVNRGLGVLGIPFRIGMPPEITIITLSPQ